MANGKEAVKSEQKKGRAATSAGKGAPPSKPVDSRAGTIINTRQGSKAKGGSSAGSGGQGRDGSL